MGCGPSSEVSPSNPLSDPRTLSNGAPKQVPQKQATPSQVKTSPKTEPNNNGPLQREKTCVAFEIGFEKNIDSLISKHPPKRLQHLAPLPDSAPKLTSQQLGEKIRIAEENRQRELEKKKSVSRRTNSLRHEVMKAREQERQQEQHELDEKLMSADRARQKKQEELAEKKRQREERGRRAREKAARLKATEGGDLDYEIEKDDGFNQDDDDSWLDGDNNTSDYHTDNDRYNSGNQGDHVYNGRTSPAKNVNDHQNKSQRMFSASTTDSFDQAYQREPGHNTKASYDRTQANDDFFDS